jgi:hypothetical protein
MGVLDNPQIPEIPVADRVAQQLKQQTRMTFQQLVQAFNQGAQQFWKNPRAKPSEIAAALGTDAKEVFELHGKIGALLATVKAEAIAPGAAVVGEFSYNNDGTVTAVDPVEPAPAPANNG